LEYVYGIKVKKISSIDAILVGPGFADLYLLHRFCKLAVSIRCFERGDGVGGTWSWNRYPGARCDVESMQYSYGFDDGLQQEGDWPEKISAQPDTMAYANHVADRYDLKRYIDFETEVNAAHFDEDARLWRIKISTEEIVTAKYFVMAGGWPHEEVNFSGKRVAVIGTGSSAIQAIPVIAKEATDLTVFQLQANFDIPSRNKKMTNVYAQS
jgi:cyclohexanone monooxygenase